MFILCINLYPCTLVGSVGKSDFILWRGLLDNCYLLLLIDVTSSLQLITLVHSWSLLAKNNVWIHLTNYIGKSFVFIFYFSFYYIIFGFIFLCALPFFFSCSKKMASKTKEKNMRNKGKK